LNLGVVYAELGNFEAAERCYLKSLEIKKELSDEPGIKDIEKNMKMLEIRKQIKIELANKNGGFIFEEGKSYNEMIANFDKHVIEEALNRAEFNVSKAAQKLDLPTSTLRSKMETLGIKPNKTK
ncbi:tetratricopeptide repeat protein, partial [bacterium]|nr:tetratricopeptide repeat protein [bacterium]